MAKRHRSSFERLQRGEMLSRRERKQIERQLQAEDPGWEIVHRNVAGIDVGNESHFVAVDARQADQPVGEFGSWTTGLHQMSGSQNRGTTQNHREVSRERVCEAAVSTHHSAIEHPRSLAVIFAAKC
jgi:hypothetical protein